MKSKYAEQLERLKARLAAREQDQDVPGLLDAGIDNLLKLDYIYQDGEIEKKREVIGPMYPEKLNFDGQQLRTNRINEAARIQMKVLFYSIASSPKVGCARNA